MRKLHPLWEAVCPTLALLVIASSAFGYTVTNLTGTYKNGQVFFTWKNPSATNLEYKLYRSSAKITTSLQLLTSTYLGYVRDNSAQNIRKSQVNRNNSYFIIDDSGIPLTSDQGLYVATSVANKTYYYAVTVVNLNNDQEDQTITLGSNSLSTGIAEAIATPQPVLQEINALAGGITQYEYVNWGDNQSPSHYPAFNNAGSYGYNFSVFTKGYNTGNSLYVYVKDNNPFSSTDATALCDNCTILKMDDWLPNGSNTYWVGWNSGYDMYTQDNPVFTTGTVVAYSQARVRQTLKWVRTNFPVDSNKVYLTGNSHNGFGALFTAVMNPDQVTVAYGTSAPILVKAEPGSNREEEWCASSVNLPSNILNPLTGLPIPIWNLMDLRYMDRVNYNGGVPYLTGVNGKNDTKVGWVGKFHWYDSVNVDRQGGLWFWDQRKHSGAGQEFTDSETTPDYERFTMARSYPGFAYCSINQDPGNGDANDGDPNGAINGYLDWDDNSISDQTCKYSITCFVKDMYMGGNPYPKQYDSCTTDLTLRRLQQFQPAIGQIISWSVKNNGKKVQSGSFIYLSGPVTLYGVKIYRTKSAITLSITGCSKLSGAEEDASSTMKVITDPDGYHLMIDLPNDDQVRFKIFDMMGRMINAQDLNLKSGVNLVPLQSLQPGMYLALAEGNNFRNAVKFVYMK